MLNFTEDAEHEPVIKVIAIGGEASSWLNTIIEHGIHEVEFIAINTDPRQLEQSKAPVQVLLGHIRPGTTLDSYEMTDADQEPISEALSDADMVFVISCFVDACCIEATKYIADYAEGVGACVMCLVPTPSYHEGAPINGSADEALRALKSRHSVLVLSDEMVGCIPGGLRSHDSKKVGGIFVRAIISGITDLVTKQRMVGIDCADLRQSIFRYKTIKVGIGMASGEGRAVEATRMALASPLLAGFDVTKAQTVVVSASAGRDASMEDFVEVDRLIHENISDDADCIMGLYDNGETDDQLMVMFYCCCSEKYSRKAPTPEFLKLLEPYYV